MGSINMILRSVWATAFTTYITIDRLINSG
jgi:hypothetical protein